MGLYFYILPQAIHRFLYFNDVEIIVLVHRCMLLLLPIIDGPAPVRVNAPSKVSSIYLAQKFVWALVIYYIQKNLVWTPTKAIHCLHLY